MKEIAFIVVLVAVIYFLNRKGPSVTAAPSRIPRYVATGINGTMDIVSVAASQPILPGTNFLNYSETAD